mgnify:CR=1 FL=1
MSTVFFLVMIALVVHTQRYASGAIKQQLTTRGQSRYDLSIGTYSSERGTSFGFQNVQLAWYKRMKPFCPWCGKGLITKAYSFRFIIPYYLHLWFCARPHGIPVEIALFYDADNVH